MAHSHQPIALVVAGEGDVGIARRERTALVGVDELCRSVPFGVVAVAVLPVGEETVPLVGDEPCAGAVAGVVVGVRLFRQARALELVGGVERERAWALRRRECRDPACRVESVTIGDRRARRRGVGDPLQATEAIVGVCRRADRVCTAAAGPPADRVHRVVAPVGVVRTFLDRVRGSVVLPNASDAIERIVEIGRRPAEPGGRLAESVHHGHRRLILPRRDQIPRLVVVEVIFHQRRGDERIGVLDDLQVVAAGGIFVARGHRDRPCARCVGHEPQAGASVTEGIIIEERRGQIPLRPLHHDRRIKG